MIKKRIKKILSLILFALLVVQFVLTTLPISAADEVGSFDNTAIEDDLKDVDLSNYPKNPLGDVDIISFMEYAYSNQKHLDKYFGIYIYVYNPTGNAINLSGSNAVNFTFYENGETKSDNVKLIYLDRTDDNLFYKFKLDESARILASARSYAAENEGKRCYQIADIQFPANSFHNNVSKKYIWEGYAAYCSDDSSPDSTLMCMDYGLKSIHLNLKNTNYRFENKGYSSICDELNSVFFTIPFDYFKDFGNVYKISAEWYEYKTTPMFVTSDKDAYSALFQMRNVLIDERGRPTSEDGSVLDPPQGWEKCYWRVLWDECHGSELHQNSTFEYVYFLKSYNGLCRDDLDNDSYKFRVVDDTEYLNRLDWIFCVEDVTSANAYRVSSDQVKEYMRTYTRAFYDQDRILGKYAKNLFTYSIDEDRKELLVNPSDGCGKVEMDFYVDPENKGNKGNSFIDTVYEDSYFLWWKSWFKKPVETSITFSPIATISEGDLYLSNEAFSNKYYVNMQDVGDIITEARRAYSAGEIPMLLRFAVTDYYASTARFDLSEENDSSLYIGLSDPDGYVAQQTVFLDFDVLSLTFQDEENGYAETVIPVVAEPIDIINGLTPPDSLVEDEEWYQKLVALMLVMIILMVLYFIINTYVPWLGAIIRWVAGAFWWLFTSLVKLITWPFRALFSNVGRTVKHKLKIKSPRRRKRRRGRPAKKKQTRNMRLMQETFSRAKSKLIEKIKKEGKNNE